MLMRNDSGRLHTILSICNLLSCAQAEVGLTVRCNQRPSLAMHFPRIRQVGIRCAEAAFADVDSVQEDEEQDELA